MWWQIFPTTIGIWLMAAPYVLGYLDTSAEMNDRILGPFIACFAIVAMGETTRNVRYWNIPLGLWMVVAAFVFAYPTAGMISAVVCGLLTVVLPLKPRKIDTPYAGGWTVLWKKDPYNVAEGSADAPANPDGDRGVSKPVAADEAARPV